MGCQQSLPQATEPTKIGKTERSKPKRNSGLSVSQQRREMSGSNSSAIKSSDPHTVSLEVDEEFSDDLPKLNELGQLMLEEVVRRTSSSLTVSRIHVGCKEKGGQEFQVSYAYRSQRGYYPDDPKKANQDKYGITLNFAGETGDAMFAVYDGHGANGHEAALFAKKKLPQILAKHVRQKRAQKYMNKLRSEGKTTKGAWNPQKWPLLEAHEFEQCCRKSFLETNQAMHAETSFDDKLCGTTAATVTFHGGRMTVCNVGDSRVLVGHRVPKQVDPSTPKEEEKMDVEAELSHGEDDDDSKFGEILAIPLTRDQTPYRKDERERVRKHGAEVKSMDQMSGRLEMHDNWGDLVLGQSVDIHGDPPRVWVQGKDYPGTAFTRSLGDRLAEEIGVNAEPEIITKTLTCNDEYLVIASDGIFEFLTNQYVMEVCESSFTPLEACEALTKAAYDQWLVHENRTDDITIIVCFLSCKFGPTAEEEAGTTRALVATANDFYGSKPLRTMVPPESAPLSVAQLRG